MDETNRVPLHLWCCNCYLGGRIWGEATPAGGVGDEAGGLT